MTATTKEQRADLMRLHEAAGGFAWACTENAFHRLDAPDWDEENDDVAGEMYGTYANEQAALATAAVNTIPALLSDSERLAAIEAVTGEEVGETIDELHIYRQQMLADGNIVWASITRRASVALLSLSAKVAEYDKREHEIGWAMSDHIKALEAKVAEQAEEIERLKSTVNSLDSRIELDIDGRKAAESERDTALHLLTETAVPALEKIVDQPLGDMMARAALSTIRAQMESTHA